jgi:probable HAF family extracellular repeat protein
LAVIDSYGKITVLNVPGSSGTISGALPGSQNTSTAPYAINDWGQVLGIYENSIGEHGFLYSNGSYSTISIPGATYVDPTGINNLGEIVGYYKDSSGNDNGFIDLGGKIQTYDVPGAPQTIISGVNNHGQLAGWYGDITNSSGQFMFVATPKAHID